MHFIEALRLRSKLFILFILITIALIAIGIIGTLNISSMKKNIDSVYFGSLVPVTELNKVLQIYHTDLTTTVHQLRDMQISPSQGSSQIENSIFSLKREWGSYESHFKRDDEMQYIEYVDSEIEDINQYFSKISQAGMNGRDMSKVSLNSLENRITHISKVIQKLINYEVDVAKYERKAFIKRYDRSMFQLTAVLSLIILAILGISLYVFKSIQSDHSKLEVATKRLKRANKKLENVSYTDALTSLHNRRYFNLIYKRELQRAKREKSYITFMMLDIDYFKQFNDTYGHIEGDYALKSVAKTLVDTLRRPTDFVFRLGGEEFGVLLTHTNETNSAKLARDIGNAVRAREIKHKNSDVNQHLTISIGIVCCIADSSLNEDVLFSKADQMLYEAKNSGRDRYMITTDISDATTQHIDPELSA
jgi:diguanylate cyclase (GGDEF)-like protein